MYANVSRSGSSSLGTPQQQPPSLPESQQAQQNLSLPGSAEMDGRPGTRRGGRPGSQSQSGESAEGRGTTAGSGGEEQKVGQELEDAEAQNGEGSYQLRGSVEVWTRDREQQKQPGSSHSKQSKASTSRRLSRETGQQSQGSEPENGSAPRGHRGSYPELSEPEQYGSEQFEKESEEGEGGGGKEDAFAKKLREMASQRTRSLHESLQSAIQRGANANARSGVAPPLPPPRANRPSTGSRRTSNGGGGGGSSSSGTGSSRQSSGPAGGEAGMDHLGRILAGMAPASASPAGSLGRESEKQSKSSRGESSRESAESGGTRIVEGSPKSGGPGSGFPPSLANGILPNGHLPNGQVVPKQAAAVSAVDWPAVPKGLINGQRASVSSTRKSASISSKSAGMARMEGGGEAVRKESIKGDKQGEEGEDQPPPHQPGRLTVSGEGQRNSGFQEIGKVPLGFGSSSARNCLISASGRRRGAVENGKGGGELEEGARRQRSASLSATIHGNDENPSYKAWLRQKLAQERARQEEKRAKEEEQEERKKEKHELAEKNFVHWKAELDRRLAERKVKERAEAERKAKKERELKEEKRTNAEKTFEFWKKSQEEKRLAQKQKSGSAEERKRQEAERKKEQKRREAEAAFHAWIQEADERKRAKEQREEEEKALKEGEKEQNAQMRRQIAEEAFGLWTRMKEEERKYKQSLAYRILDFELKSNTVNAPWHPTSPTVHSRLHRPPPELVQGRRRTLEKRLILPHSRPSRSAVSSAKSTQRSGKSGGGTLAKSVDRRPWK